MKSAVLARGVHCILHTDDEWNGLHGIIDDMDDTEILVFCVQFPYCHYKVRLGQQDEVLEIVTE